MNLEDILVDDSKNLRRFAPNSKKVQELADSILKNGQLQPVIVSPGAGDDEGKFHLVAGFRRFKAVSLLNQDNGVVHTKVLARVKQYDTASPTDTMRANLAENKDREDLTPMDYSSAIKSFREVGMSNGDIAKEFGKSKGWVSQMAGLIELRPDIQKKIHAGEISYTVARTLSGLSEEEQDKILEQVANSDGDGQRAARSGKAAMGKNAVGKGRKKKSDQPAEKKGLSAKAAVLELEGLTVVEKDEEGNPVKVTKAVERAGEVCKLVVKLLTGKSSAKVFHKNLLAVVN